MSANEIKTTMTMEQQQFLREMAKQVNSIARSAQAFVEMKQQATQAGQGVKQSLDLSLPSIKQLGAAIVGYGTLSEGVLAGIRGAIKLTVADFEKLNQRAGEAVEATRNPANAIREAALNVRPEELDWLQENVTKLSADPRINATMETGARVLSGIRSAAGNVPLKDVQRTAEVTLRGIGPDRPDAAEQFGIALMDAMSSERRFVPDLTPEAAFGGMLALQAGSHMASIQDTAKSFGPLQAALGVHGQRFHETAAPFGALTVFNKDQTGQVSAEGFRKTSEELMSFVPENDAKRLERLDSMFNESLNSTDFAGTKDTEKRQKYRDRLAALDLKDPGRQAEEMIKLLEEIQSAYREGSDTRTRLSRDIARIKVAQTHQRSTDIGGMPVDVPLSEVELFQQAKTPVEKLWTMGKTPNLAKSAQANIEFGRGKTREFFVGWMNNDPVITKMIRDAEKDMTELTNAQAVEFEKWVTKLNATRLQVMARSQQRLQSSIQRVELGSPLDQQFGLAKKTVEAMHAKSPTSVVGRWIDTSLKPIFEQREAVRDPIGVAVPKLQSELERIEKDLNEGRPIYAPGAVAKATPFGFVRPKPIRFEPLEGQEREQREAQRDFTRSLIEMLEQTKAGMSSEPRPQPVKIEPAQQSPQPVKIERKQQQPVPAGQKVGKLITSPIKQRLRPDIDFQTADTGDEIARQMALAHPAIVPVRQPELRTPQQRIREDVIDRALATAHAENVKGVTREGLAATAEQWGDDTTGFANKVKDYFHAEAQRRSEESRDWMIDVDPNTGEGKRYRDLSVDRLYRAGGEIQDAPIREMQRSDGQRRTIDLLAQAKAVAMKPVATEEPAAIKRVVSDEAQQRYTAAIKSEVMRVSDAEGLGITPAGIDETAAQYSGKPEEFRHLAVRVLSQKSALRGEGGSDAIDRSAAIISGMRPEHFESSSPRAAPLKKPSESLLSLLTPASGELEDVPTLQPLQSSVVRLPKPIEPKPFVPSDPERFEKAQRAVAAGKLPREARELPKPKPFNPSDPERFAKATAAMEQGRSKRNLASAEHRDGLNQPLLSAFEGNGRIVNAAPTPLEMKPVQQPRAMANVASSRYVGEGIRPRGDAIPPMQESRQGTPQITVQGGDTKPVVAAIDRQTALLEKLIQVTEASHQQPKPAGKSSKASSERTTTRPTAALAR